MTHNLSPIVSVCMITFNHKKYISQAIEGVLMQEVDFKLELVIGDDCSSDSTRAICESYAEKYPAIIKLLASKRNLGMITNFTKTLNCCQGKYIALCEGDDYWTDSLKLQKQVDILNRNDSISGIFHDVYVLNSKGLHLIKKPLRKYSDGKGTYSAKDVLINWMGHTCSFVFRRSTIDQIDLENINLMDSSLAFIVALKGNLQHITQIMGVYRDHPGGITKAKPDYSSKLANRQEMYNQLNIISEFKFNEIVDYHLLKLSYMYELACNNGIKAFPIIFKYYSLFSKYNFRQERIKNLKKYLSALIGQYYFG